MVPNRATHHIFEKFTYFLTASLKTRFLVMVIILSRFATSAIRQFRCFNNVCLFIFKFFFISNLKFSDHSFIKQINIASTKYYFLVLSTKTTFLRQFLILKKLSKRTTPMEILSLTFANISS